MKTTGRWFPRLALFSLFSSLLAASPDTAAAEATRTNVTEWQAKRRSEHETVWQSVRYATNPATGRVRATTNSYIELSTGLNREGVVKGS